MPDQIENLQPSAIWKNFAALSKVPRGSKKEGRVVEFIKKFGEALGLETHVDEVGNVVIRKPATKGMENRKTVVLQSHLDMVHQKNNDVAFDFDKDPIQPYVDGDWVKAKGTTLGSDNGMGVCASMSVLESKDIPHGPIEALFTIDEETGMTGAFALKPGFLQGDILLNMDSEDEGELCIGCAGGVDTNIDWTYTEEAVPGGMQGYELRMTGLKGGHSGVDIHLGRGNSNKLLGRFLFDAAEKFDVRLSSFTGGTARNAIPRESVALVAVSGDQKSNFQQFADAFKAVIYTEFGTSDPSLDFKAVDKDAPAKVMKKEDQAKFVNAVHASVNGVIRMSQEVPGLTETSTNLSIIKLGGGKLRVESLQRSFFDTARDNTAHMVGSAFRLAGANVEHRGAYPGWKPNPHSEILELMKKIYERDFGKAPEVNAVHAGLECGIIGEKYPEMELISFGPTIKNPHSPDEMVNIPTVQKFWDYLLTILKEIPEKK